MSKGQGVTGKATERGLCICMPAGNLILNLATQISTKQENLQELTASCKATNVVHLSPTLISKGLTKLLTNVKKLPKCPVR